MTIDCWTLNKTVITKALIEVLAPWEGNHVDSKLPQVCVQLPWEPKEWIVLMFSTFKPKEPGRWIALMSTSNALCVGMNHLRQVVTPDIVIETRWLRSP